MRNRSLHDALRGFALEAAALLTDEVAAGAELSFDVIEAPGRRGAVLYNYRPRTAEFIAERWHLLRGLPTFAPAAAALGAGAAVYLRVRGERGADAEPALRAMLERLYEDATSFELPEERFERVYAEVERVLCEDSLRTTIVTPVRGLAMEGESVDLGAGLSLVRGDLADAPPEAAWSPGAPGPNVVCVLERSIDAGAELPLDEACDRLLALQTALRLFRSGGVSIGPLAWSRAEDGAWRALPVGAPADPRPPGWLLARGEEADLVAFLRALGGTGQGGAVGWALSRFEMGCERERDVDALTDHLLALRALIGSDDDAALASLPLRVAALCVPEEERRAAQTRLERALALERFVVARPATSAAYVDEIGPEPPSELSAEVEEHLRALLSDVLTGQLDRDLGRLADDILLASGEPLEISAQDLRPRTAVGGAPRMIQARRLARDGTDHAERVEAEHAEEHAPADVEHGAGPGGEAPAAEPPRPARRKLRSQLVRSYMQMALAANPPGAAHNERDERSAPDEGEIEPTTTEIEALRPPRRRPTPAPRRDEPAHEEPPHEEPPHEDPAVEEAVHEAPEVDDDDPGVTPSADWDFDEDPESYSAPV